MLFVASVKTVLIVKEFLASLGSKIETDPSSPAASGVAIAINPLGLTATAPPKL